jgi:methylmalonyl-CoA mutase C-terminal domain/subunit
MGKIRVLIAKPGLDGHESGARLIARFLRDAGMEVIYLGSRQTAKTIVDAALQEGVDVIGLSVLSGIHKEAASSVLQLLKEKGSENISLVIGGIIPKGDIVELKKMGVRGIFGPGTDTHQVVNFIRELASNEADNSLLQKLDGGEM